MKKVIMVLFIGCAFCIDQLYAQPSYSPSFAGLVVGNIESSSNWYKSVLQLEVKSQSEDPGGQYKMVLLASKNFSLELLELTGSLKRSTVLSGKPSGTQIQGLFKFGFKTDKMDQLLTHLANKKVTVPQVWTDSQTGKRNFIITDPEGNLIQFFE